MAKNIFSKERKDIRPAATAGVGKTELAKALAEVLFDDEWYACRAR